MPMRRKLKSKRRYKKAPSFRVLRLLEGLAQGKTQKQAALDAGLSSKNPSQSAHQALAVIREHMPELMDKYGLSAGALIEKYLLPQLDATQIKVFAHRGKVTDAVEMADNRARVDALDMAFKLRGMYAPVQGEQENKQKVKCIVIDVPRPKRDIPPPTMVRLAEPFQAPEDSPKPAADPAKSEESSRVPAQLGSLGLPHLSGRVLSFIKRGAIRKVRRRLPAHRSKKARF